MDKQELKNRLKKAARRYLLGSKDTNLIWENAYKETGVDVHGTEDGKPLLIVADETAIDREVIIVSEKKVLQTIHYNVKFELNNTAIILNGHEIY